MTDPEMAPAWAEVHVNTPDGWFVGQPGLRGAIPAVVAVRLRPERACRQWGRERQWMTFGQTETAQGYLPNPNSH